MWDAGQIIDHHGAQIVSMLCFRFSFTTSKIFIRRNCRLRAVAATVIHFDRLAPFLVLFVL